MDILTGIDKIECDLERYVCMVSKVHDKTCHKHEAIFEGSILVGNHRKAVFYTVYVVACLLDLSLMQA